MKKIYLSILVLAVVLIFGFGYVRLENKKINSINQPGKAKTLNLGIINFPTFAFSYLAQEKGYFEEEGVDVNITTISDLNQLIPSLGSKQLDLMISSADFSTIIKDSGVDAPQILITDSSNGADGLLVTKDISKLKDLKSKSVNLPLGYPSHFLFRYAAREQGLSDADIKINEMSPDQVGVAFLAKKINAGMTWEPWLSKGKERPDGKVLFSSRDYPDVVLDTIVARREVLNNNETEVKAFLRGYFKAVEYWKNNRVDAEKIMAGKLNIDSTDFTAMMQNLKPYDYQANINKFNNKGDKSLAAIEKMAIDIFRADGIIKNQIEPSDLIDDSLVKTLYEKN